MPFDKITLNSGQALIIPHCPENLDLEKVGKKQELEKKAVESFGLFDIAQPNFSNYYPEVKAEDLNPTADQFIRPVFRMLSETIVHRKFNPIDFAKNHVLKASMPKLLGQTLFANHESSIGNQLGSVAKVVWENAYIASNGIRVPAGINGELLIDGKSHPNIARGILMNPPSIHSNSVTVSFEWEQSHPKMDVADFRGKIGSFGEDGELIRRVVKEIVAYHETSLVAHGADPFAQLVRDGEINNPVYVKAVEQLSAKTGTQHYFFSYKTDTTSLSEEELTHKNPTEINLDPNMKDILALLAVLFGVTSLTEEEAKTKLSAPEFKDLKIADLIKAKSDLETEKAKVTEAEKKKTDAETVLALEKGKVIELEALKPVVEKVLSDKRTEVTRMYKVIHAGKEDTAMLESITKADDTLLSSLQKSYQDQMDQKFPGQCNDCKSTNVSRNTVIIDPNVGAEKKEKKEGEATLEKPLTNAEVVAAFAKKPNTSFMHGKLEKVEEGKK